MYLSIIGVYSFILILSVSCSSYFVAYNLFDEACQATLSQDFSNGTVQCCTSTVQVLVRGRRQKL